MKKNSFSLPAYYELIQSGNYDSEEIIQQLSMERIDLVGWQDHIAETADVRAEIDVGKDKDGNPLIQHIRHDGFVFTEGTPVNAEHLGLMEWNDLINALKIQQMTDVIRALQVQVATLIGQNNNNMPYNSFVASAKNIDSDLVILEGWYDEINGRGVLA